MKQEILARANRLLSFENTDRKGNDKWKILLYREDIFYRTVA
jgi:hypothetical protein